MGVKSVEKEGVQLNTKYDEREGVTAKSAMCL